MDFGISVSDLSNAVEVIAETVRGISGPKIVTYCTRFASKSNTRIPHPAYPFDAPNKRTALLQNLCAFGPELQFALILELCDDRTLVGNKEVQEVRDMFVERYGHYASTNNEVNSSAPAQPPWAAPAPPQAPAMAKVTTPAAPLPKPTRPYEIFISYAHEDEDLMNLVREQLVVFDRQGLIRKWWDRKLTAGRELDPEIRQKLAWSDIVILIVSASFLASDYCYDVEMKQALDQHASGRSVVVPVIARPCSWTVTPLGKLLALPTDGLPLTQWNNRDQAALVVAQGIMRIVAEQQLAKQG